MKCWTCKWLRDNIAICLSKVEPIAKVLQLPLQEAQLGDFVI